MSKKPIRKTCAHAAHLCRCITARLALEPRTKKPLNHNLKWGKEKQKKSWSLSIFRKFQQKLETAVSSVGLYALEYWGII